MTKKLKFIALLLVLSISTAWAQVPPAFNYQAVARNNAGVALANQSIQIRLSIMQGNSSLYSETRSVTTNLLGLFNVQIGGAGATSTTGNFASIAWLNNSPWISLKVELDIANTNVFTDMGTQVLASVPYALASGEAINTTKIGGNAVATATPTTGDLLKWNGTAWTPTPAPTAPAIYSVATTIGAIPFGGGAAPWVKVGTHATVTVTVGQTITANFVGVFGHGNISPQPCAFSVCYEPVVGGSPTGVITSFQGGSYPDGNVAATPNKTTLSATGAITLPAGTYRIFLGLKNKSTNVNFQNNDYVNGTIIVF